MDWFSVVLDNPQYAFGIISLFLAYHIVKTFVKSTKSSIQSIGQAVVSLTRILESHDRKLKVIEKRETEDHIDEEFRKLNNLPVIRYQE